MAAKKVGIFVTGTTNSFFFVTRQTGMKFGMKFMQKTLLNLSRRVLKIFT